MFNRRLDSESVQRENCVEAIFKSVARSKHRERKETAAWFGAQGFSGKEPRNGVDPVLLAPP